MKYNTLTYNDLVYMISKILIYVALLVVFLSIFNIITIITMSIINIPILIMWFILTILGVKDYFPEKQIIK
jgi:hypothetical protein